MLSYLFWKIPWQSLDEGFLHDFSGIHSFIGLCHQGFGGLDVSWRFVLWLADVPMKKKIVARQDAWNSGKEKEFTHLLTYFATFLGSIIMT